MNIAAQSAPKLRSIGKDHLDHSSKGHPNSQHHHLPASLVLPVIRELQAEIIDTLTIGDRVNIEGLMEIMTTMSQSMSSVDHRFDLNQDGRLRIRTRVKPSILGALRYLTEFRKL